MTASLVRAVPRIAVPLLLAWGLAGGGARAEPEALIQQRENQWTQDAQRRERLLSQAEHQAFAGSAKRGVAALGQAQFEVAVASLLSCLTADPEDYLTRWYLGVGYLRIGRFAEAEATLRLAAAKAPDLAEAWYYIGVARMRMNRFRDAIEPLQKALDLAPDYLEAAWNLRLAVQQAGQDPEALAERYRLPLAPWHPAAHESVRFTDVGLQAGVALVNKGRGSAWGDLNHDGWLDLFTVAEGSTHALFLNDGDGTFTDVTRRSGLVDARGGWSALWIDGDNDGVADLFVTRDAWSGKGTNTLYHGNADATFADVTRQAGLESGADGFCAAWGDYDNDGWLDLYVGNGVSQGGWPNALYHSNKNGTYTDVATQAGVDDGLRPTIGVVWGDCDNDGWLDLYVVNHGDRNSLYRNRGDGTFADVTWRAGVVEPHNGFVAFFFDYDNDGWLDLFASSWTERMEEVIQSLVAGEPVPANNRPALYQHNGNGTFADVTRQAGLARTFGTMAATFGDVDNDGYPDIYLANGGPLIDRFEPDRLFLNNRDGTFAEVTELAGVGNLGKGHGPTMADYDNDGDLDIYAPQGGMGKNPGDNQPNSLYRNEGNLNRWLDVELAGGAGGSGSANRDGVGARVVVTVGGAVRTAEVSGGSGFGVTNSLRQHFGLGSAAQVDAVEVRWPSGRVDRRVNMPAGQVLSIREAGKVE